MSHQFTRKPLIAQILKRWLLVGRKVPYKFPNDIASKLLTLHGANRRFVCQPKNGQFFEWPQLGHRTRKKKKKNGIPDYIQLHTCANLWVKIAKFWGVKKIRQRFSEVEPLDSKPHQMPPGCRTPQKWYHHIAQVSAHLQPPSHFDAPSLLH